MENFFKFFDDLSVDETQYWRLKAPAPLLEKSTTGQSVDDLGWEAAAHTVEVLWQRRRDPFPWSYRVLGTSEWIMTNTALLEKQLLNFGVSKEQILAELTSNIMTQVVHAQMVLEAGEKLLGKQFIHQATRQTNDFLSSLQKVTESLLAAKAEGAPKKNPESPRGKSYLKLVDAEPDLAWELDL